jgi:hypothetical protein
MSWSAPKPLASLSGGLLARKGQARPAMRPHGYQPSAAPAPLDDLGWNDLGDAPAPPPVVQMQEALREEVETPAPQAAEPESQPAPEPEPEPAPSVSLATAARIGRESAKQTRKGKAAFTLRLDAERHLRLRLASAVTHRSAQGLVADALDRFLDTMPEVDALAAQLPAAKRRG